MRKFLLLFLLLIIVTAVSSCKPEIKADKKEAVYESAPEATEASSGEKVPLIPAVEVTPSAMIGNFVPICQYPELPTGCETVSLTMTLNYYGIDAEKCDIADNYLTKGTLETAGFKDAFIGNPRNSGSFGCFAPVIEDTANRYLAECESQLRAYDITGTDFEGLFPFVCGGVPVIVWGTYDCAEVYATPVWTVNGETITFPTPEHCMVLVGYDESTVWVADPNYGDIRAYDREIFKNRYDSLFKQAVVLR